MKHRILSPGIPTMPWEDCPPGHHDALWRSARNPLIGWNPIPTAARIYNSALVPFGPGFRGVFRADHRNGRAHLHRGSSPDGYRFNIDHEPIVWIGEDGQPDQPSYAYDPRVVKIEDWYYITWCVDFHGAALGLGRTKDFETFYRLPNPTTPFNRNGVLFPRRINNKYLLLTRPSDSGHTPFGDIFLSESPDMVHWGRHQYVMGKGGSGWWQGTKIGAGPNPIETDLGWLLFYHGVSGTCNGFVYSIGAAILDRDQPSKVLYRTRDYLLTPELPYETTGFVPNVAFPCSTLFDDTTGRIAIYYGAADTYTALAFTTVDRVIEETMLHSEVF